MLGGVKEVLGFNPSCSNGSNSKMNVQKQCISDWLKDEDGSLADRLALCPDPSRAALEVCVCVCVCL